MLPKNSISLKQEIRLSGLNTNSGLGIFPAENVSQSTRRVGLYAFDGVGD
jgi:hypothetical protein